MHQTWDDQEAQLRQIFREMTLYEREHFLQRAKTKIIGSETMTWEKQVVKSRIMFLTIMLTSSFILVITKGKDVQRKCEGIDSDTSQVVGQAVVFIVEGVEMSKSAATRDRNVKQ